MREKILEIFGKNLRAERSRLGYSQEKLAGLANLQMQHLGKIENGQSDIKFTTLIALLKALNIPFDKLYDLNDEQE